MPVSNRELQALEIIRRYGGQIGYSVVAQAMHVSTEYARTICQSLGQADYIDMASSGLCKIAAKGIEELLNRGSITLADLAPADEEAGVPQEAGGSQTPWDWPDVLRQEAPRPAAPASTPENMVDLKCAYCYGRGTDPFGCPSPSSKCAVCGGKGYNRVVAPYATCTACGGTGKLQSRRMNCTTCKGKGVVTVRPGIGTGYRFGTSVGAAAPTAPGAITSTTLSAGQRGQVAPISLPRSEQPASVADQIATYITHFPSVKAAHVEALLGLSKSEAEGVLRQLVRARKIHQKDDGLYYPA